MQPASFSLDNGDLEHTQAHDDHWRPASLVAFWQMIHDDHSHGHSVVCCIKEERKETIFMTLNVSLYFLYIDKI